LVDEALATAVEANIGMEGEAAAIKPFRAPIDLNPSPALSIVGKSKPTLEGRKIGVLVTDGVEIDRLAALREAVEQEGAQLALIAPKIGGVTPKKGARLPADMALSGAPSVFFDAVALLASDEGVTALLKNAAAVDWVRDAFGHLKAIGYTPAAQALFAKASIAEDLDEGVVEISDATGLKRFVEAAKQQRVWDREARLSGPR
jgi:catalase